MHKDAYCSIIFQSYFFLYFISYVSTWFKKKKKAKPYGRAYSGINSPQLHTFLSQSGLQRQFL